MIRVIQHLHQRSDGPEIASLAQKAHGNAPEVRARVAQNPDEAAQGSLMAEFGEDVEGSHHHGRIRRIESGQEIIQNAMRIQPLQALGGGLADGRVLVIQVLTQRL
jgi:hypothetical protein